MRYAASVGLILVLTTLVNGFGTLVPTGKEFVYDYNAVIKAGTVVMHKKHDSAFFVTAKLYVQSPQEDILFIQLKDVTVKVFNGEAHRGFARDLKSLPLPEDASDLTKPFKVVYAKSGQVESIVTDKTEKLFARNMHKAIANTIQVKKDGIDFNSDVAHGFTTMEHTIYGRSRAVYNVLPRKDEIIVQKMHDMKTLKEMHFVVLLNIAPAVCDAPYDEPVSHDSQQVYIFKKEDGDFVPTKIDATGSFYLYPFHTKSDFHYIQTTVKLELVSKTAITTPLKVDNELSENDLGYNANDPNRVGEEPDTLSANHNIEYKQIVSLLEEMLNQAEEYWHENKLKVHTFDIKKSNLVYQMVKLLMPLKLADLEKMYEELRSKTTKQGIDNFRILNQLLPLIGTRASVTLVTKIVRDKKVEEKVALYLLQGISSYVQHPNEQLLKDIEHILTWGSEVDATVRRIALLNFAVLIQKTYNYQRRLETHENNLYDVTTLSDDSFITEAERLFLEKYPIYNKYVEDFADKMKKATDLPTQMLYTQLLHNTAIPTIIPHILPIATGKVEAPHDVRALTLYILSKSLINNTKKLIEVFWPIFTDWKLETELRLTAYYSIMLSRPTMSRLLNIFWEMKAEPNPELYHFHYSFLEAMATTTDPCRQVFKLNIQKIFKFTPKPIDYAKSRYFQVDYMNTEYGFGGEYSGIYFSTPKTKLISLDSYTQASNIKMSDRSLFIKIGGLSGELDHLYELNLKDPEGVFNYEKLLSTIASIPKIKNVQIQIGVNRDLNIIQAYHFNEQNMNEFYSVLDWLLKDQFSVEQRTVELYLKVIMEMLLPTETGMPAYLEVFAPLLNHEHLKTSKETQNGVVTYHVDKMCHTSYNFRWGLRFYNPLLNLQQGVVRVRSIDFVVPIRGDFSVSLKPFNIKASIKMDPEPTKNKLGLRTYAANFVYAENFVDQASLEKSCEKCKNWKQITIGEFYRNNDTLVHNRGAITGIASKVVVFDWESYGKPINILTKKLTHTDSGLLTRKLMGLLHEYYFGMLLPSQDTYGYLLTVYPTDSLSITQIDVSLRLVSKLTQSEKEFLPAIKLAPRLTYTLKSNDKPIQTWDVNVNMDLNAGHTLQNTKLEITRIVPEKKDYKMCIASSKKWVNDGVSSETHIGFGETTEGVCSNTSSVTLSMTGVMTEEQKSPYHQYEVCNPFTHDLGADYYGIRCALAHSSIRKYNYDLVLNNLPPQYTKKLDNLVLSLFKEFKPYHRDYPTEGSSDLNANHIKAEVEYLNNDKEVNFKIIEKDTTQEFIGLPADELSLIFSHHDNTHYSRLYKLLYGLGAGHNCLITHNRIQYEFNRGSDGEAFEVPAEWKVVVGDTEKDATNGVFVKRPDAASNDIALKLVHNEHSVEFSTVGPEKAFQILIDGKEISQVNDYYNGEWFNYVVRESTHEIIASNIKFKFHMVFNGEKLNLVYPAVNGIDYYGPCVHK